MVSVATADPYTSPSPSRVCGPSSLSGGEAPLGLDQRAQTGPARGWVVELRQRRPPGRRGGCAGVGCAGLRCFGGRSQRATGPGGRGTLGMGGDSARNRGLGDVYVNWWRGTRRRGLGGVQADVGHTGYDITRFVVIVSGAILAVFPASAGWIRVGRCRRGAQRGRAHPRRARSEGTPCAQRGVRARPAGVAKV